MMYMHQGHRYKLHINRCNELVFKPFCIKRLISAKIMLKPDECFTRNSEQSLKYKLSQVVLDLSAFKNVIYIIPHNYYWRLHALICDVTCFILRNYIGLYFN